MRVIYLFPGDLGSSKYHRKSMLFRTVYQLQLPMVLMIPKDICVKAIYQFFGIGCKEYSLILFMYIVSRAFISNFSKLQMPWVFPCVIPHTITILFASVVHCYRILESFAMGVTRCNVQSAIIKRDYQVLNKLYSKVNCIRT